MRNLKEEIIRKEVTAYSTFLDNLIQDIRSKTEPASERYMKWKLDKFSYDSTGLKPVTKRGEYHTRNVWKSLENQIKTSIVKTDEYSKFTKFLKKYLPKDNIDVQLESLHSKMISRILSQDKINKKKELIEPLVNDILDVPQTARAQAQVTGLTTEIKKLNLMSSPNIVLRQTTKEDLEIEIPESPFLYKMHNLDPTAIVEIELGIKKNEANKLQTLVKKTESILRLLFVGSISCSPYSLSSKTILGFIGGTISNINIIFPDVQARLTKKQKKSIVILFKEIYKKIPEELYKSNQKQSPLSIAFEFYKYTLLERGSFDRRVANAIMGLEALILNENSELKFKLSLRVSKLMSFFDFDSLKTKKLISDAYNIRSRFAHGSILSQKEKNKLSEKHGSLEFIQNEILNYLRILMITFVLNNTKKNSFISLIDESFLNKSQDLLLKKQLSNITSLVIS